MFLQYTQYTQKNRIAFIQCLANVEDVGLTFYKCYANIFLFTGYTDKEYMSYMM